MCANIAKKVKQGKMLSGTLIISCTVIATIYQVMHLASEQNIFFPFSIPIS